MVTEEHKDLGKTGQVVMRLMEHLLDKGHYLVLDSGYTSFSLFKVLANRLSEEIAPVSRPPLSQSGETSHVANVLGLRFHEKRDVYFLSTMHRPGLVSTSKKAT